MFSKEDVLNRGLSMELWTLSHSLSWEAVERGRRTLCQERENRFQRAETRTVTQGGREEESVPGKAWAKYKVVAHSQEFEFCPKCNRKTLVSQKRRRLLHFGNILHAVCGMDGRGRCLSLELFPDWWLFSGQQGPRSYLGDVGGGVLVFCMPKSPLLRNVSHPLPKILRGNTF